MSVREESITKGQEELSGIMLWHHRCKIIKNYQILHFKLCASTYNYLVNYLVVQLLKNTDIIMVLCVLRSASLRQFHSKGDGFYIY